MAALGAAVAGFLGHSNAEKVFKPWWQNLEDFLAYSLVMLAAITIPTAIVHGSPLQCNYCFVNNCDGREFVNLKEGDEIKAGSSIDPGYNYFWVPHYCTEVALDGFIVFFPYILLIMTILIVLVERVFMRIFKGGLKLDVFYNLVVKDALDEEQKKTNKGNVWNRPGLSISRLGSV